MRVLVSGSRSYKNRAKVYAVLDACWALSKANESTLIIVHGDCPTGADAYAASWALGHNVEAEAHPAQWKKFGPSAGPKRNLEMVTLGADLLVAFPRPESKGTKHTIEIAKEAEMNVLEFPES